MVDNVAFFLARVEPRNRGERRPSAMVIGEMPRAVGTTCRLFGLAWQAERLVLYGIGDNVGRHVRCFETPVEVVDVLSSVELVDEPRQFVSDAGLWAALERPRLLTPTSARALLFAATRDCSLLQRENLQRGLVRTPGAVILGEPREFEPRASLWTELSPNGLVVHALPGEPRVIAWRTLATRACVAACASDNAESLEEELRLCLGTILSIHRRYRPVPGTEAFIVASAGQETRWRRVCAQVGVALVESTQTALLHYPWPSVLALREDPLHPGRAVMDRFRSRATFRPGVSVEGQFSGVELWGEVGAYRLYCASSDRGPLLVHALESRETSFPYDVQIFRDARERLATLSGFVGARGVLRPCPPSRDLPPEWESSIEDIRLVAEGRGAVYSATTGGCLLLVLSGAVAHEFAVERLERTCATGVLALEFAAEESREAVLQRLRRQVHLERRE